MFGDVNLGRDMGRISVIQDKYEGMTRTHRAVSSKKGNGRAARFEFNGIFPILVAILCFGMGSYL